MYIDDAKKFDINEKDFDRMRLKLLKKKQLLSNRNSNDISPTNEQYDALIINSEKKTRNNSVKNKYQIINSKEVEDYKEDILLIKNLWDELGVTKEYQNQFFNLIQEEEDSKKILLYYEKENLLKFRNCLIRLKKEIGNREKKY